MTSNDVPFFLSPLSRRIHSQVNLGFRRERFPHTRNLIIYFPSKGHNIDPTDTSQESIFIRHRSSHFLFTGSVRCPKVVLIPAQHDALTVCRRKSILVPCIERLNALVPLPVDWHGKAYLTCLPLTLTDRRR